MDIETDVFKPCFRSFADCNTPEEVYKLQKRLFVDILPALKDKERAESLELLQQAGLKSTVIEEPIFDRKILRTSFSEGGSCFEVKANKSADEIAVVLQKILGV